MSAQPENEFTLKFDGKPNEVDAATLGYSLLNVTTIIQEVNNEINKGQPIEIKVKGTAPGSFLVHIGLDPAQVAPLMQFVTPENLKVVGETIGLVVKAVVGVFSIRKALKGKFPQEVVQKGDEVIVRNSDGNTVVFDKRTYKIYVHNTKVNEALTKTFKTLDKDSSVTGFEIVDRQAQPMLQVPKEEFIGMALGSGVPRPERQTELKQTKLHIIKLSFERTSKWELLYQGIKVPASIAEDAFFNSIDRGESFSKGDVLDVELEIEQVYDPSINAYENKNYVVKRVIEHIPRAKQVSLFERQSEESIEIPERAFDFDFGESSPDEENKE